ncbi:unnamed protein product [Heligmosomoides polygyrus]|uniref:Transposase n=1 Tax=Heligmosomoides polygyrus TaxID=6339 RepID=A0A183F5K6_HELPZ|nr:unnamed protein product [Heligmosomoides polygyrus]
MRKQDEHAISVAQRGIERTMLGMTRLTQMREGIRSSEPRRRSKIRRCGMGQVVENLVGRLRHALRSLTRAVTDWIPRDVERTSGSSSTRWLDFFVKALNDRYDPLRVPRARRIHWSTQAHNRDEWRRCLRPLEQLDD